LSTDGNRYEELDSLRGVAALSVVINHFSLTFTSSLILKYFGAFGHEAVIFFFVLSGFVLSLGFKNGTKFGYKDFMLKRFIRIYFPYWAAIILMFIVSPIINNHNINMSEWFDSIWTHNNLTISSILNHVILLGSFDAHETLPVIWSLTYEMRISFFIPLMALIILKFSWKHSIIVGITVASLGVTLTDFFEGTNYYFTMYYLFMFIIGSIIAKYRNEIIFFYNGFHLYNKLFLFCIGILCYFGSQRLRFIFSWEEPYREILNDLFATIGSSIFIIFAISSTFASKVLNNTFLKFLGKISYSLYLFHTIVLLTIIHLFYSKMSSTMLIVTSFVFTLILSTIAYYLFEYPSIKLAKKIRINKNIKSFRTEKKILTE